MRGSYSCTAPAEHRGRWMVVQRNCNYSAFNGYHYTRSDYSAVFCPVCDRLWRTKAAYVDTLPDAPTDWAAGTWHEEKSET